MRVSAQRRDQVQMECCDFKYLRAGAADAPRFLAAFDFHLSDVLWGGVPHLLSVCREEGDWGLCSPSATVVGT